MHTRHRCFVYQLSDPRTNAVRYIGLSENPLKRLRSHCRNPLDSVREWLFELRQAGLKPRVAVLEACQNGQEGDWRESFWIDHYMRRTSGSLLNVSSRTYKAISLRRCQREYALRKQATAERRLLRSNASRFLTGKPLRLLPAHRWHFDVLAEHQRLDAIDNAAIENAIPAPKEIDIPAAFNHKQADAIFGAFARLNFAEAAQ